MSVNRPFPSCFEPHFESEAKCKIFVMKISFHSRANKTNFHMKSFALSLVSKVRFTVTRKWPIEATIQSDLKPRGERDGSFGVGAPLKLSKLLIRFSIIIFKIRYVLKAVFR